ncbi:MAG: diadenylate cyclase CdaA [Oscillospiraceae bacterium]|nr:diadenylate cyclase CdaA [Oscillospiraceae bacterium]
MFNNFYLDLTKVNFNDILNFLKASTVSPIKTILFILDIAIVLFLAYKLIQIVKGTRAGQLLKGIALLILITFISGWLGLTILNYILTYFMTYGVIILIVVFQPELRRALEQLGTSKLRKFFGINVSFETKLKENIYKIAIAVEELSRKQIGGLIVLERDIKVEDIINTGVLMNAEISPQLIVNIFTPKTPLHDGAIIISDNKIAAVACMLPLADDKSIAKDLGTRHRSAIGMSRESDSIVVVVSEETGKISIARDGRLYRDLTEDNLRKILIKNLIEEKPETRGRIK